MTNWAKGIPKGISVVMLWLFCRDVAVGIDPAEQKISCRAK